VKGKKNEEKDKENGRGLKSSRVCKWEKWNQKVSEKLIQFFEGEHGFLAKI
jgi:hypothetical protein